MVMTGGRCGCGCVIVVSVFDHAVVSVVVDVVVDLAVVVFSTVLWLGDDGWETI
jgi:hypothetical protein